MLGAIEKVLTPTGVAAAEIAHDLSIDVEAEGLRMFEQAHTHFIGESIAFAIIAALAAGDEVVPV